MANKRLLAQYVPLEAVQKASIITGRSEGDVETIIIPDGKILVGDSSTETGLNVVDIPSGGGGGDSVDLTQTTTQGIFMDDTFNIGTAQYQGPWTLGDSDIPDVPPFITQEGPAFQNTFRMNAGVYSFAITGQAQTATNAKGLQVVINVLDGEIRGLISMYTSVLPTTSTAVSLAVSSGIIVVPTTAVFKILYSGIAQTPGALNIIGVSTVFTKLI